MVQSTRVNARESFGAREPSREAPSPPGVDVLQDRVAISRAVREMIRWKG